MAGSLTGTLGTFTPLRSPSSPPLITLQRISFPDFSITSNPIRPSSIKITLPASTSSASPLYVIDTRFSSPTISSVVSVNSIPVSRRTFFPSLRTPVRISGPFVSSKIATFACSSSRICFNKSIRPLCSS